jgi:hypothetical protein
MATPKARSLNDYMAVFPSPGIHISQLLALIILNKKLNAYRYWLTSQAFSIQHCHTTTTTTTTSSSSSVVDSIQPDRIKCSSYRIEQPSPTCIEQPPLRSFRLPASSAPVLACRRLLREGLPKLSISREIMPLPDPKGQARFGADRTFVLGD